MMTQEDIEFIKNYIDFRLNLIAMGLLSDTERRICQIFVKILEKEGVISNEL